LINNLPFINIRPVAEGPEEPRRIHPRLTIFHAGEVFSVNKDSRHNLPENVLERLLAANSALVMTGAGMSAESGIPTFRDAQTGIWAKYSPEELATPGAFEADPGRVWSWYEDRRSRVRAAEPHRGHSALVELEAIFPELTIVTQNVDGLHQRSGSANVIELHGNILRSICHVTAKPIDDEARCGLVW
jgi:NAD-dependent deacetylase